MQVRGGTFSFKGGGDLSVKSEKKRKKEKKKAKELAAAMEAARKEGVVVGQGIGGDPGGDAKGTYEERFPYEVKRQQEGKGRTQCWGTNYRAAPEILHGYTGAGRTRSRTRCRWRSAWTCGAAARRTSSASDASASG